MRGNAGGALGLFAASDGLPGRFLRLRGHVGRVYCVQRRDEKGTEQIKEVGVRLSVMVSGGKEDVCFLCER